MARVTTTNYQAEASTTFWWATVDGDFFDRELDMAFVAQALDRHDHASNRGLPVARVAAGSIVSGSFAAGAVDSAALGALSVINSKLGPASISNDKLQDNSVSLAKIQDNNISLAKMQAGSVDNTKLVAGSALANLGFTPVNKAGDTMTGTLTFSDTFEGIQLAGGGVLRDDVASNLETQLLANDGRFAIYNQDTSTQLLRVREADAASLFKGLTQWNSGHFAQPTATPTASRVPIADGSGKLNGWVDGVPSGAVVYFQQLSELTAAGAGWQRYSAGDGRILIGAGITAGQTFSELNNVGANWTPASGLAATAGTLVTPAVITSTAADVFGASAGGSSVSAPSHQHTTPSGAITGAPALTGTGTVWLPPMRVGIWGRKL